MGLLMTYELLCDTPGCGNRTSLGGFRWDHAAIPAPRQIVGSLRGDDGWITAETKWGRVDVCPVCAKTRAAPAAPPPMAASPPASTPGADGIS